MQRAFRWATKMGYIDHSPIAHIEKPPAGTRDLIVSRERFDDEAAVAVFEAAFDEFLRDASVTAVSIATVDLAEAFRRYCSPQVEEGVTGRACNQILLFHERMPQ